MGAEEIAGGLTASGALIRRHIDQYEKDVECVAGLIVKRISNGGKVFFCGNGGSAAQAQHFAAEFVGRFACERKAFPAIALTADTAVLTAVANDYSYSRVFHRQVTALVQGGDVFVALSTSGTSESCKCGAAAACVCGAVTIALTGKPNSELAELCDYVITVDSDSTATIQEVHLILGHAICGLVEEALA